MSKTIRKRMEKQETRAWFLTPQEQSLLEDIRANKRPFPIPIGLDSPLGSYSYKATLE